MSCFYVVNGGVFNSNINCIVYTKEDNDIEEFYKSMNQFYGCSKISFQKTTSKMLLKETNVNICKMTNITKDHFINIMNKLLDSYFITDELKEDGVGSFADNMKNTKLGYKNLFGFDYWFICMSFTNIKKIVLAYAKDSGFECKVLKYPFVVKEKKPKKSKRSVQIEESDEEEEKQKVKKVDKKMSKSKSKSSSKKSSISDDEDDNGIVKPEVEVKTSNTKQKPIKTSGKIEKVVVNSDSDSDSDIEEEMIITKKAIKKTKETKPVLNEIVDSDDEIQSDTEEYDEDELSVNMSDFENSEKEEEEDDD